MLKIIENNINRTSNTNWYAFNNGLLEYNLAKEIIRSEVLRVSLKHSRGSYKDYFKLKMPDCYIWIWREILNESGLLLKGWMLSWKRYWDNDIYETNFGSQFLNDILKYTKTQGYLQVPQFVSLCEKYDVKAH